MAFNINTFRSQFNGDGARPTLFEVEISFPASLASQFPTQKMLVSAKASNLPASNIGFIEVPYFGRKINVGGDRIYDDWVCTVINDEDFACRNALEFWNNSIDQHSTDSEQKRVNGANANPGSYVANINVKQYGKQGNIIKQYTLVNAFPYTVGQIDVSWESNDQIEEFDVSWKYDYFVTAGMGDQGSVGSVFSAQIPNIIV